jgi:hypothetical protein
MLQDLIKKEGGHGAAFYFLDIGLRFSQGPANTAKL